MFSRLKSCLLLRRCSYARQRCAYRVCGELHFPFNKRPQFSSAVTSFFQHYKTSISSDEFKRTLTSILNCSKSSNALIRTGAVQLWTALVSKDVEGSDLKQALESIATPMKTGKSNGVDHRQALYSMIRSMPCRGELCSDVVVTAFALWEKETSDAAIVTLAEAFPTHLEELLRNGTALGDKTESIIVKEAGSAKPAQRRAMLTLIGEAFWALHVDGKSPSESASTLLRKLEPGLLKLLKDASASTVVQGVVDHWIALLLILRHTGELIPIRIPYLISAADSHTSPSALLQSILFPSGKPSFLYSEKNYQKVDDPKEAIWLLRVLEALTAYSDELVRQEKARYDKARGMILADDSQPLFWPSAAVVSSGSPVCDDSPQNSVYAQTSFGSISGGYQ